jgi:acetyl-CoA acetyltransferase
MPPKSAIVPLYGNVWNSEPYRSIGHDFLKSAYVRPEDIDVALIYEAVSMHVPAALETYGLVPYQGAFKAIVEEGVIGLDSRLPVNTHGGHLSEAYIHGSNHLLEAVAQLRHQAVNQVPNAQRALFAVETASAVLLRRTEF